MLLPVGILRRIEDKGCLVVGRREVPGKNRGVLGAGVVRGGGQDQFSGEGGVAQLDPNLPVEAGLAKGVMLAGNPSDLPRSNIVGGSDLVGGGTRAAPKEEIDKGNID